MGKFLREERWYDKMPTTGTLRMKRVSAKREEQFPLQYRAEYQQRGAVGLVKKIQQDRGCMLHEAWAIAKEMMNGEPQGDKHDKKL